MAKFEVTVEEVGRVIEHYVILRQQRLALQKEVEAIERQESEHKQAIEACLVKNHLTTAGGKYHRATIVEEQKPSVEDWGLVYNYMKTHDAFDLVQRRLTETAVKARWEEGQSIPGIVKFPVTKLSITKF